MPEPIVPRARLTSRTPKRIVAEDIRTAGRAVHTDATARTRGPERRHAGPPDHELVERMGGGDISALEQVYDRYSALVFSVALRVVEDRQLAEDIVQEVFLRIWRQPASFDPERGRFVSWLMAVTRNRSLDERRRLSRRWRSEDREDDSGREIPSRDPSDDPLVGVEIAEARRAIRLAMAELPEPQRVAIELAFFGGLTQVEIADRTGDPLGTVKTRIRLGMRKLRVSLGDLVEGDAMNGGGSHGSR